VIENALSWLRNNEPAIPRLSDEALFVRANLADVTLKRGILSLMEKKETMKNVLEWLRNSKPTVSDLDYPTLTAVADAAGITLLSLLSP
jgi:hypothetical protein